MGGRERLGKPLQGVASKMDGNQAGSKPLDTSSARYARRSNGLAARLERAHRRACGRSPIAA